MKTEISIQDLLDAGVHYGHITRKWNPKMAPYIFGKRNGVHILDLTKTLPLFDKALNAITDVTSNYGRILFVGTKMQASETIKEAALKCGQYYINQRWLGGTLTNWKAINQSIKRMKDLENKITNPIGLTKKEIALLQKDLNKLDMALGGIRNLGGRPDMLVIIDTKRESIAVKEAVKLGIPIVAIVDSDSCPDNIDFPIPGNDDAIKAIELYCNQFAEAALAGLQKGMEKSGIDIGASTDILKLHESTQENNKKKNIKTVKTSNDKKNVKFNKLNGGKK